MRLISKTALLAVIVSALACHDDVAGTLPLPRLFTLTNINGRDLPTYFTPVPESRTIISSTLELDGAGNATLTERVRQMGTDAIQTSNYTYTISGDQISFFFYCPPDANCIAPPHGTISDSTLSLDMSGGGREPIVYNYRRALLVDSMGR